MVVTYFLPYMGLATSSAKADRTSTRDKSTIFMGYVMSCSVFLTSHAYFKTNKSLIIVNVKKEAKNALKQS